MLGLRTAGALVICLALVAGPAGAGTGTPPATVDAKITSGKAAKDLAAARARWKAHGYASYRFDVQRSCFCPPKQGQATIVVRGGRPSAVKYGLDAVATMPRLFVVVSRAIHDRVARLSVRYDTKRGYVRSVYIDRSELIADEEVGYGVTKLRALRRR